MIVPVSRSAGVSEENVLPLINVVFLLLIFFMIAGSLSAAAPLDIDPPAAASPPATEAPRGGVLVGADGGIAFGDERIGLDALTERARDWQVANDAAGPLPVRVDAGAPTGRLLATIDALREAGIERIRLLTVGAPRGG